MRRLGSRNAAYAARRRALLEALTRRLRDRASGWPTMRELAISAGCSVSTLRHYFGRREDLVAAVLAHIADGTGAQIAATRQAEGGFAASLAGAVDRAQAALYDPVISELLGMGLIEALSAPQLGPTFLDTMLDPFVAALAERLDAHIAQGEMRPVDTRLAAMAIISPVLVAALHQTRLGGAACRPLDPAAHARQISAMFVAAYGTGGAPSAAAS
ncbi:TetR/AcrR family transcriptional regulator [Paracoccus contaminans]|nr:TetR/AcrR family transcriptional regulator [Paracoccus contaminans]